MERVEMLSRGGAYVLERLNKTPESYVKFTDLLKKENTSELTPKDKRNAPVVASLIKDLEKIGYVTYGNNRAKITENGQTALAKYKVIEEIANLIP